MQLPISDYTDMVPILHGFRDMAFDVQNGYIRLPLLCLTPPTEGFSCDILRKILPGRQQMATYQTKIIA